MSAPTIATPSPPSARPNRPSRTRLALVIALALGVVVVLLAAILLYDHSRRDRIANGVTIDTEPSPTIVAAFGPGAAAAPQAWCTRAGAVCYQILDAYRAAK